MGGAAEVAAQVPAPTEGSVYIDDVSATSQRVELPKAWRLNWIRVKAVDANVHIVFGDASVTVDETAVSTLTSEQPQMADDLGDVIVAGTFEDMLVPDKYRDSSGTQRDVTHMAFASAGTGKVVIRQTQHRNEMTNFDESKA